MFPGGWIKKLLNPDISDQVYIAKLKDAILEDFIKRTNSKVDVSLQIFLKDHIDL